MPHALFVAAFDSQLKWCARIRLEFESRGFTCRVIVPEVRAALSDSQILDAGFTVVERASWRATLEAAAVSDVVVCSLAGPTTKSFTIDLSDRMQSMPDRPRPIIVTGWVGIIFENITAGYLARSGSDVVAVNSVADLNHFLDVAGKLDLPTDNLLLTGLPFLSGHPAPQPDGPIQRVLFADQPTVPGPEVERRYVYEQLVAYARAHPTREVLLKPRHRIGEDTFHRMRFHPETLLDGVDLPPNFRIDYTPISEVLDDVDLLLTLSSTACLEAVDRGCRVGLVLDLGVHERYGNHVFLDSGLLRTFSQIGKDDLGEPAPRWRDSFFLGDDRSATEIIADRVQDLLASGKRPSTAAFASAYVTSTAEFHRAATSDGVVRSAGPKISPRSLRSRRDRHGRVMGTAVHVSYALLPPIMVRPLRSAARSLRARG